MEQQLGNLVIIATHNHIPVIVALAEVDTEYLTAQIVGIRPITYVWAAVSTHDLPHCHSHASHEATIGTHIVKRTLLSPIDLDQWIHVQWIATGDGHTFGF